MLSEGEGKEEPGRAAGLGPLLWLSGLWVAPVSGLALLFLPHSLNACVPVLLAACVLAPIPAVVRSRRDRGRLLLQASGAREEAGALKLQLETVRYRTARLREDLLAAGPQARLSHQLTLLGRFTAGFMHEFNNPLAIVASRIEALLGERPEDASLCADLQQMLKETRYMGNIAQTLLRALRRERGNEVFAPAIPAEALSEALDAFRATAERKGVRLIQEAAEVPRVDVPEHVISEVVRGLVSNALDALWGRQDGVIWVRLEPYRAAGAKVIARIEDNGPGVPAAVRERMFEPFVSQAAGRERLGLGLFLAASLMDMYEGSLRYEPREGGGAIFIIEMPPARFAGGQPSHWFERGVRV